MSVFKINLSQIFFCIICTFSLSVVQGEIAQEKECMIISKNTKLRVLVDKVITRETRELNIQQAHMISSAGFNVVSPKFASIDYNDVVNTAKICKDADMLYMPWMRGTLTAKKDTKMIWANGIEQNICSPNSDEFWEWFSANLIGFAKASQQNQNLIGVFLDFENYAPNKQTHAYSLSYDTKIIKDFALNKKIEIPSLNPSERFLWLKSNGLHEEFDSFQVNYWKKKCRELRKRIDQLNPSFQITIYQGESRFVTEAMLPNFSTKDSPIIMADSTTYGRPSNLLDHNTALEANKNYFKKTVNKYKNSAVPLKCIGGIDPVSYGADPEFCARNASMLSEVGDGYWVFYEGLKPSTPEHEDYLKWFSLANRHILEGNYGFWRMERQTPDESYEGLNDNIAESSSIPIGLSGVRNEISDILAGTGKYQPIVMQSLEPEYLKQFKIVMLQNFNVSLPPDHELMNNLRNYVQQGGSLFLTHDTGWYFEKAFSDIAVAQMPVGHANIENYHVADSQVRVVNPSKINGQAQNGEYFYSGFRDHVVFKAGPNGIVLLENEFNEPVCVIGKQGEGQVAFSGCMYGYRGVDLQVPEKVFFLDIIDRLLRP